MKTETQAKRDISKGKRLPVRIGQAASLFEKRFPPEESKSRRTSRPRRIRSSLPDISGTAETEYDTGKSVEEEEKQAVQETFSERAGKFLTLNPVED